MPAARCTSLANAFCGSVPNLMLCDQGQADLVEALAQTRDPFGAAATWPQLDDLFGEYSTRVLTAQGEAYWQSHGGIRGNDGHPTLRPDSRLAGNTVDVAARQHGGVLWQDESLGQWAVRLVAMPNRPAVYHGFAIQLPVADPTLPQPAAAARLSTPDSRRAAQVFMALHMLVLRQRSSVVMVPDVLLGQIAWGGDQSLWPQNWRQDRWAILHFLTHLRSGILRLAGDGWHPRFVAHGVALASVDDLKLCRPGGDSCSSACPMWNRGHHHSHYLCQIGLGFLGVLEHFATDQQQGQRIYDFSAPPEGEQREAIEQERQAGTIVSVPALPAVFGASCWSGISPDGQHIMQSMLRELTRQGHGPKQRRDGGAVVTNGMARGVVPARKAVKCPLLAANATYVCFGGNGVRAGMGYLLVGRKRSGWLAKCGVAVPPTPSGIATAVRQFFAELEKLRPLLGLTIVGVEPATGIWYSWSDLQHVARQRTWGAPLDAIHLRVYAAADYLDRFRQHMALAGRFAMIPGDEAPAAALPAAGKVTAENARLWLTRLGISQTQVATAMGISQPCLYQFLMGKRPWPGDRWAGFQSYLSGRLADAAGARSDPLLV